jgi:hypothetical protein
MDVVKAADDALYLAKAHGEIKWLSRLMNQSLAQNFVPRVIKNYEIQFLNLRRISERNLSFKNIKNLSLKADQRIQHISLLIA